MPFIFDGKVNGKQRDLLALNILNINTEQIQNAVHHCRVMLRRPMKSGAEISLVKNLIIIFPFVNLLHLWYAFSKFSVRQF